MTKRFLIAAMLSWQATDLCAQQMKTERVEWCGQYTQHLGRDEAWHIHQLPGSGQYILTGLTTSGPTSTRQAFLQLLDADGSEVAFEVFDPEPVLGPGETQGYEIHPVVDPGQVLDFDFVFAGTFTDTAGHTKALVMGVRQVGNDFQYPWMHTFPDAGDLEYANSHMAAFSAQQVLTLNGTVSDGFIVAGFERPHGQNQFPETNGLLIRVDNQGQPLATWPRVYDVQGNVDVLKSVQVTDNGTAFVSAGFSRHPEEGDPQANFDVLLVKDGSESWIRTIGDGASGQFGEGIKPAAGPSGGWLITGGQLGPISGLGEAHLIKTDIAGTEVWTQRIPFTATNSYGQSLIVLNPGPSGKPEYMLTGAIYFGTTSGFPVNGQLLAAKFDSAGHLGYRIFAGDDFELEHGYWIQPTADGGFVIAGTTYHGTDPAEREADVFVMKLAPAVDYCGDVNGDGGVNSADVILLVNHVFTGGPLSDPWLGDVNGFNDCPNALITSADVVYLTAFVFKGGSPPSCAWCMYAE